MEIHSEKKITNVKIDNRFFADVIFDYVTAEERAKVWQLLDNGSAIVCGFFDGEEFIFGAVIEFYEPHQSIHIRHVGGHGKFSVAHDVLDLFCLGLATALNYTNISLVTEHASVEKWAKRHGYQYSPIHNEFRKYVKAE